MSHESQQTQKLYMVFREVPQPSTKFSPFELVYEANPMGPICLYKELLVGNDLTTESKSSYELVTNIRDRVMSCELAVS